ncbi:amidohydrolase family protein [Paeniglutamicibacter antarcticus]|uniref:Amidohydrolase family protein n=1 Tax=Arthrobacter terrae TaxID=2935737 RepID=A0A931CQB9_9MICC|nr:amidohydrolase family protein [Arthrobacter terrae]MBG0739564.1 amidohydrolase family protein [Arthrobacter terrae]
MTLTLYRNGSVYSAADPFATAMLVDGDTVAWVGTEHAAASLADQRMHQVDLDGALITPGFIDSHVHVTETGIALASVDLTAARSLAEALALLAAASTDAVATGAGSAAVRASLRAAGSGAVPIRGHGWDETRWPEGRPPTADELDRATGGREVYLSRIDVHSGVVSSALAARARLHGLDGWLGEGLVARSAHAAARDATRTFSTAQRTAYQLRALHAAAAAGYVAVVEMSAPHVGSAEDLQLLAGLTCGPRNPSGTQAGAGLALPQVLPYWGQAVSSADEARSVLAGLGTEVLGLAGDLNIDGSIGSHSALLREPYADSAGSRGTQYLSVDQVTDHLAVTSELGIQGGFHLIGDAAMDIAVEGLRRAAARVGIEKVRAAGHRFEHAEMADDDAIAALAAHSVTVSVQPSFDALWGGPGALYQTRLGKARAATLNPIAAFYAAGVPVCFGSDAPVTPMNPWASVRAALSHHQSTARISARAAFLGHSRAGWRAVRESDPLLGQLVPGAPASFAVWDVAELMVQVADDRVQSWSTDPRARTPLLPALDAGEDPQCLQTVHRGVQLHSVPGFGTAGFGTAEPGDRGVPG